MTLIFRVIGYFVLLVAIIYLALLIVGKKPQWFIEPWKKALLYCFSFALFVGCCFALDFILKILAL